MPISRQPFRARDVRANILELGFEKGIELSLTLMADEMVGVRSTLKEMAEIQSLLIDRLTDMTQVNGAMAQKISEMHRVEDQFDESRGEGSIPTGDN